MILQEILRKMLINTSSSPSAGLKEIRLRIYSAELEVGLWLVTLSCLFYGGLNVVGIELNGATIIIIITITTIHCLKRLRPCIFCEREIVQPKKYHQSNDNEIWNVNNHDVANFMMD